MTCLWTIYDPFMVDWLSDGRYGCQMADMDLNMADMDLIWPIWTSIWPIWQVYGPIWQGLVGRAWSMHPLRMTLRRPGT